MSTSTPLTVANLLGYKLKKTQHALRLRMDEALKQLDLTTPQYSVLAHIELQPGISNATLAKRSFMKPQSMHGIILLLERRQLIIRTQDPRHQRVLCTNLTAQGKNIVQQAHSIIMHVEHQMTSTLSASATSMLESLLQECFNNLTATPRSRF